MKLLTPMIAGNFTKFVPSSKSTEDTEEIPVYASENYFEDALPAQVLRKFQEAAEVSAVISLGEGCFKLTRLKPTRGISIRFRGDTEGHASMYSLHQIEKSQLKVGSEGEFEMKLSLPKTPPSAAQFQVWVRQSVNQAARNRFRETFEDAELATQLNAALSTRSQLRFDVLRTVVEPSTSQPLRTANTFLNMDLPILEEISVENLMKVREDEQAFANFRFALDHTLSRLRETSDVKDAKRIQEEAIEDLTGVQLREVKQKVSNMYRSAGRRMVTGGLVSLVAAVQNQGLGLLTAATTAVASAGLAYYEVRDDIKLNPAFFLWKALDKKARKLR
jgi:hypothetical protein